MTVWDALIGQPRAVETLQRAALDARNSGTVSHSWLITGPPGSGRSVAATAFAASLQCTGEPVGCGECSGCRTTLAGSNLDVTILATEASLITVQQVRQLMAVAQTRPVQGQWRVIVVEDADRMREDSANMLLKNLEEPPPQTVWLLCAPTPADLLVTIRSRCRQLQLGVPAVTDIADSLIRDQDANPEAAALAAQVSQSHIGVARALVRDPQLRQQRVDMFMSALRVQSVGECVVAAGKLVKRAQESGAEENAARAEQERAELARTFAIDDAPTPAAVRNQMRSQMRVLEENQKRREKRSLTDTLDRVMIDLLGFFRDVSATQLQTGAPLINPDLAAEVEQWAQRTNIADTYRRVDAINLARQRLVTAVAPLVNMESLLITLHSPEMGAQ